MKTYCVKCRKYTKNFDPKMVKTKNNRLVMQPKCSACGIKVTICTITRSKKFIE